MRRVFETPIQMGAKMRPKHFYPFFGPAPTLLTIINAFYRQFRGDPFLDPKFVPTSQIFKFCHLESSFYPFLGPNCLGTPQEWTMFNLYRLECAHF